MKNKFKILISTMAFIASSEALSSFDANAILKYSNCTGFDIIEPENSSGFFMSADCKKVYIKPPKQNEMKILSLGYNLHLNSCEDFEANVLERSSVNEDKRKRIARLKRKISELETVIDLGGTRSGMSVSEMEDQIDKHDDKIAKIIDNTRKEIEYIKGELATIALQEGATSKYHIVDSTSKLRAEFIKLNKKLNLNFYSMPLKNSMISYNSSNISSDDQGKLLGEVLDNGIPLNRQISADGSEENVNIGDGDLTGSIKFSKVGSCALKQAGINENDSFSLEKIKNKLVVNRFNEYTIHIRGGYKVTYNLSEIVKIIHKQVKKKGLFKNKTKNSKLDMREFNDVIKFTAFNEESEVGLTAQEYDTIRKEFIDRSLKKIVALKTGNAYAALQLLQPDAKNGVDVAAGELSKCLHLYCQIGAAGLKVLSAIFGSTEAVSEFHSKFNANLVEEARLTFPISAYTSSTYL